MVYATRGLIDSLLGSASDADPDEVSIPIAVTDSSDLPDSGLSSGTPVFTHFYMPEAARSVNFVFGVDLGTPAGQTQGQFVSHPNGELRMRQSDDFKQFVFVAVPPWERDAVAVFTRDGQEQPLEILDVEPPQEFPG